jgi:hypothetical protein
LFTIGEEQFETLKQFDQALKEIGYPQNVWVSLEQFVKFKEQHVVGQVDDSGIYVLIGFSRIRAHGSPALDTIDNPKWRKM